MRRMRARRRLNNVRIGSYPKAQLYQEIAKKWEVNDVRDPASPQSAPTLQVHGTEKPRALLLQAPTWTALQMIT